MCYLLLGLICKVDKSIWFQIFCVWTFLSSYNFVIFLYQSESKELININETPREVTPVDMEVNHQENALKPQENNNNNNHCDEDEKALKREHADKVERPPPPPLPLLQYKRRRQNESNNKNSSRTTQESSTTTTLISSSAAAAATSTAISALLEFSLMDISEKKPLHKEGSHPTPLPSHEEKLNDLYKEIHEMSVERETFKLEMMSAEAMISILQSRIDALRQENDELKKNSANGH